MARASGRRRRRAGGAHEDGGGMERWLLTYADMITLLMALFIVLFSISSLNISKYRTLQQALKAAFSGQILPGGKALERTGAAKSSQAPNTTATTSIMPLGIETSSDTQSVHQPSSSEARTLSELASVPGATEAAALQEQSSFVRLEREIQAFAAAHGISAYVHTTIEPRGLVISLLTDRLLFASGQATLSAASYPLLELIGNLLELDRIHPIAVEGNTDSVPIDTSQFPSNWELSTARASTIVRFLIAHRVASHRLSAIGYADQRPAASNASVRGRALNRRVEIVVERLYPEPRGG
jgi:chemotaxis protein MotB